MTTKAKAKTYTLAPRIIRAVLVKEPGTYEIDGVPFEADHTHVGFYYSLYDDGAHFHIVQHSSGKFERTWVEVNPV
jgi:hypothetical protein